MFSKALLVFACVLAAAVAYQDVFPYSSYNYQGQQSAYPYYGYQYNQQYPYYGYQYNQQLPNYQEYNHQYPYYSSGSNQFVPYSQHYYDAQLRSASPLVGAISQDSQTGEDRIFGKLIMEIVGRLINKVTNRQLPVTAEHTGNMFNEENLVPVEYQYLLQDRGFFGKIVKQVLQEVIKGVASHVVNNRQLLLPNYTYGN